MRTPIAVLALTLAACSSAPTAEQRAAATQRVDSLADVRAPQPDVQLGGGLIRLGRDMTTPDRAAQDAAIRLLAPALDAGVQAAFDVGASGSDMAPEILSKGVGPDASPALVAAAAAGLCACKSDGAEAVLVDLALRPSHPPEALEALFSYYRWRGGDKAPPAQLPDLRLVDFERHPAARGRAALAHLGRAVKDPVLVPVLEQLARDPDAEVRRAVALSLADGVKTKRLTADGERCLAACANLLRDSDARVVASACRSVASYTPPTSLQVQQLVAAANHADFNVRVAALEGLGKFVTKDAPAWRPAVVSLLTKLASGDPSTSVRYTAAEQLIGFGGGMAIVDGLLADPSEYVRAAGADALGKSEDVFASPRLARVAKSDAHVRVRETAVGGFEGKKDSAIAKDAVRAALADPDVGVAATACGVVAKNEWKDMVEVLLAVPARFPGCAGADAREAAVSAVAELDGARNRAFLESFLHDTNPGPRGAAEKAVAKLDGKDPPKDPTRGADLTGQLCPGGAPIFDSEPYLVVETDQGTMRIRLYPEQAPVHCAHVAALARAKFYDGLTWHRVVPDFVIQGGCPRGDGSGNAGVTLPIEPTRIPFERGTLGMPRSDHPDTGGCQLFICHSRAPHLDVHYTAFGKVVEGLDVIDRIDVDSRIVSVRVEGAR